jgi:hypothetical protein
MILPLRQRAKQPIDDLVPLDLHGFDMSF